MKRKIRVLCIAAIILSISVVGVVLAQNNLSASEVGDDSKEVVTYSIEQILQRDALGSTSIKDNAIATAILDQIEDANWLPLKHDLYYSPKAEDGFDFVVTTSQPEADGMTTETVRYFFFEQEGKYFMYNHYKPYQGMMYKKISKDLYQRIAELFETGICTSYTVSVFYSDEIPATIYLNSLNVQPEELAKEVHFLDIVELDNGHPAFAYSETNIFSYLGELRIYDAVSLNLIYHDEPNCNNWVDESYDKLERSHPYIFTLTIPAENGKGYPYGYTMAFGINIPE